MAEVIERLRIAAPSQRVWDLIGAVDAVHIWHPAVEATEVFSENGVTCRRLRLANGEAVVETIDAHSDDARSYSYTMTDFGPLPLARYHATITVTPEGEEDSLISWKATFETKGVPKFVVSDAVSRLFKAGFEGISRHFGGSK